MTQISLSVLPGSLTADHSSSRRGDPVSANETAGGLVVG